VGWYIIDHPSQKPGFTSENYQIRWPSYKSLVPLIPKTQGLISTEKFPFQYRQRATALQPVVLVDPDRSGIPCVVCVKSKMGLQEVSIRQVQQGSFDQIFWCLIDVPPQIRHFGSNSENRGYDTGGIAGFYLCANQLGLSRAVWFQILKMWMLGHLSIVKDFLGAIPELIDWKIPVYFEKSTKHIFRFLVKYTAWNWAELQETSIS